MEYAIIAAGLVTVIAISLATLNLISYRILKPRLIARQQWDLNICCGNTDAGRINVDIVDQPGVSNFVRVDDIYNLPFGDKEFANVLCSHTLEHVEDPQAFWKELNRIGENVTLILPPLWDVAAVLNMFEHRWIFLIFRKAHNTLPPYIKFSIGHFYQDRFGQVIPTACGSGCSNPAAAPDGQLYSPSNGTGETIIPSSSE